MSYVLENSEEAGRLERQSNLDAYDHIKELSSLILKPNQKILDAGCGSGLVSRYLLEKENLLNVEACDVSVLRLRQAMALCNTTIHKKIHFFESTLENILKADNSYDVVICRYVLEHVKNPNQVLSEFFRVLNPGGLVYIIDFDGLIFNLFHQNLELKQKMDHLQTSLQFDPYIGRKIPALLIQAGFTNPHCLIDTIYFHGDALIEEQKLMCQRFHFALPAFTSSLGSKEKALNFIELYCGEMVKTSTTLFYNKFIVQAQKPF